MGNLDSLGLGNKIICFFQCSTVQGFCIESLSFLFLANRKEPNAVYCNCSSSTLKFEALCILRCLSAYSVLISVSIDFLSAGTCLVSLLQNTIHNTLRLNSLNCVCENHRSASCFLNTQINPFGTKIHAVVEVRWHFYPFWFLIKWTCDLDLHDFMQCAAAIMIAW